MELTIKRQKLWEDSIFDITLPEADNDSIVKYYEDLVQKEKGQKRSNIGGWQREVRPGECQAYDDVLDMINYAVTDIFNNVFGLKVKTAIANSWLNSNELGEANAFHTHPGCVFSGVYYINASKDKENGMINFVNMNHHTIEEWKHSLPHRFGIEHKDIKHLNSNHDYMINSNMMFPPSVNHAYVFMPWLGHEVRKNPHAFNRLVIGMNFKSA
jgi:uncharacterized protein (TIGR02466 family)